MKIAFTNLYSGEDFQNVIYKRLFALINTFKSKGFDCYESCNEVPDADIWIIRDFNINKSDSRQAYESIMKYKGKVVLFTTDDLPIRDTEEFDPELWSKVDGFVGYYSIKHLNNKIVQIPIFSLPYSPPANIQKQNKICFVGSNTGIYHSTRIKAVRKMKSSSLPFEGGLISCDESGDPPEDVACEHISCNNWDNFLGSFKVSLCLAGNAPMTYRHWETMKLKCKMVTTGFGPHNWMFREHISSDMYYPIKDDLSNIVEVSQKALDDDSTTKEEKAFDFYKKYIELNPDDTYQDHVWHKIMERFMDLNIL